MLISLYADLHLTHLDCLLSPPPVRAAVRHHDEDTRDRCLQRGFLLVAVQSGQQTHCNGDEPGDENQEGGKREVRVCRHQLDILIVTLEPLLFSCHKDCIEISRQWVDTH